jgi:hypothetical protein
MDYTQLVDTEPTSEWGIVTGPGVGLPNKIDKRFWVVENFYEDPDAVRDYALSQVYYPGEGAVGSRTRKQFLFDGVKERFEDIMGIKIAHKTPEGHGWYDGGINGRFQSCPAGTNMVFHCDAQQWAAVLFLSPNAPTEGGTSFFKHKETGVRHSGEIDWEGGQGNVVFNQQTFIDPTPYEAVDTVGNVYNRLVIFDGQLIHSGQNYFGWDIPSSRFFQIFFFDEQK